MNFVICHLLPCSTWIHVQQEEQGDRVVLTHLSWHNHKLMSTSDDIVCHHHQTMPHSPQQAPSLCHSCCVKALCRGCRSLMTIADGLFLSSQSIVSWLWVVNDDCRWWWPVVMVARCVCGGGRGLWVCCRSCLLLLDLFVVMGANW